MIAHNTKRSSETKPEKIEDAIESKKLSLNCHFEEFLDTEKTIAKEYTEYVCIRLF